MKKLLHKVFPWSYLTTTVKSLLITMVVYLFAATVVTMLCNLAVGLAVIGIIAELIGYAAMLYFIIGSIIAILTFTNTKFDEGGWNK